MNDTTVISTEDSARMQQASEYKSTSSSESESNSKPLRKVTMNDLFPTAGSFNKCNVAVLFTIGLADYRFDSQMKPLLRWKFKGVEHNLYNPFRKGKTGETPFTKGVLRNSLAQCLEIASTITDSNVLFLGKPNELKNTISSAVQQIELACQKALIIPTDTLIATLQVDQETEEGPQSATDEAENENGAEGSNDKELLNIYMSDIVRVTSWVKNWTSENTEGIFAHDATIHFYVNPGFVYDSSNKLKAIRQIETILLSLVDTYPRIQILMGVDMSAESLANDEMLDLFRILPDSDGYQMFTQRALLDLYPKVDFCPDSKKGVLEKLLNAKSVGDFFFVKNLSALEEEQSAEEQQVEE